MKTTTQRLEPIFDQIMSEHDSAYAQLAYISGEFEKHLVLTLLEQALGNVSEAARKAKMPRESLWNIIKLHSIDPSLFITGDAYVCPDHTENPQ